VREGYRRPRAAVANTADRTDYSSKLKGGQAMTQKTKTCDDYLATLDPPVRAALTKLRRSIMAHIPDATECWSYGMPAFRLHGQVVAGFHATKSGCSYYPFSGSTLAALADELADYSHTKSALHFTPAASLPDTLVHKLLDARIAEVLAQGR
jgi:uncharacterized protein YdhG (YjbR/CyaY superfamily)